MTVPPPLPSFAPRRRLRRAGAESIRGEMHDVYVLCLDESVSFFGDLEEARRAAEVVFGPDLTRLPGQIGRAKVSLEQEAGASDVFPVTVDESISIFSSSSAPDAAMKIFREVVSGRDFRTCMSDVMKASVGSDSGVEVKLVDAKASQPAPEGGLATAIRIDISAGSEKASMQLEFYIWRYENAGVSLQFSGAPEKLDAKLVGGALDAATKALKATAKK